MAFVTCALYPNGYFNAYDHIAKSDKLDAVVELGDYIYEYGSKPDDYGMANGARLGRLPEPPHDLVSLADYRTRYAQYRRDADLQAAHARAPWICVWDDHEVCNDTWKGGAENHHEKTEGAFQDRKANAMRAYFEWMPIREPAPGMAREAIYRSFDFGDLASLTMLESRLLARSYQLEFERAGDIPYVLYDATTPGQRRRVTDPQTIAAVKARTPEGGALPAPYVLGPDVEAVTRYISDPSRQMLGPEQEAWLQSTLAASAKAGRPWQVVGNQVIMGPRPLSQGRTADRRGRPRRPAGQAAGVPPQGGCAVHRALPLRHALRPGRLGRLSRRPGAHGRHLPGGWRRQRHRGLRRQPRLPGSTSCTTRPAPRGWRWSSGPAPSPAPPSATARAAFSSARCSCSRTRR